MELLLYLALIIALGALYAAHTGPVWRNPSVWLAGLGALAAIAAAQGAFVHDVGRPPRLGIMLAAGLAWVGAAIRFGDVRLGKAGIRGLLAVSLARLPVELMLYELYLDGQVPKGMTWAGGNLDVLSGLGALVLLVWLSTQGQLPKGLLLAWAVVGLGLVLYVVGVGLLSAPTAVQRLNFDSPNVAITHFPFVLLPTVIVPAVLYTHVRLLLGLLGKKEQTLTFDGK